MVLSNLSKFVLTLVFAIVFGINGIYFGESFFNFGFYLMVFTSIPYLLMGIKRIKKERKIKWNGK